MKSTKTTTGASIAATVLTDLQIALLERHAVRLNAIQIDVRSLIARATAAACYDIDISLALTQDAPEAA